MNIRYDKCPICGRWVKVRLNGRKLYRHIGKQATATTPSRKCVNTERYLRKK